MAPLNFERGDPERPVGHAFLCFGQPDAERVAATYLVVPPIELDFAKYVPPLLASSLGSGGLIAQASFLPVPPAPEEVDAAEVRRLATVRGDDVLIAPMPVAGDIATLMGRVAEIGDSYARLYRDGLRRRPEPMPQPQSSTDTNVDALLYSLLPEQERLDLLAKKIVELRYAIELHDQGMAESVAAEMRAVAAYLPSQHHADELIEAASRRDRLGARLAQLYLERSYKICQLGIESVADLDEEIAELRRASP